MFTIHLTQALYNTVKFLYNFSYGVKRDYQNANYVKYLVPKVIYYISIDYIY